VRYWKNKVLKCSTVFKDRQQEEAGKTARRLLLRAGDNVERTVYVGETFLCGSMKQKMGLLI
jgi:hypothetical protein